MADIKSRAMLRRLKDSRKLPTTLQSGTIAEKQLAKADFGSKAIIIGYNPESDKMMGKLPSGKEIGMTPITQGSLAKGDTVFQSQGFCDAQVS